MGSSNVQSRKLLLAMKRQLEEELGTPLARLKTFYKSKKKHLDSINQRLADKRKQTLT